MGLEELLSKLSQRIIPDDLIEYRCLPCRDTGFLEESDPRGRDGSVLVRRCPNCGGLTLQQRRGQWRKADLEEQQRVREWRTR